MTPNTEGPFDSVGNKSLGFTLSHEFRILLTYYDILLTSFLLELIVTSNK